MDNYPKLRHLNCQQDRCSTCFEDHLILEEYLIQRIDSGNRRYDHLGRYHKWLSDNGINPETEWGWATEEAFDPKNIEAYIAFWKEE